MSDLSNVFTPISFADCPHWAEDDLVAAFAAFRRSAVYAADKTYRSGSLGIDFQSLIPAFTAVRTLENPDQSVARQFFETYFIPCHIKPDDAEHGFVTGFYEPEIEASLNKTDKFNVPFLRKPDDLIKVDDDNRPADWDASLAFARQSADCLLAEYDDRSAIEQGSLAGRGLEIAYVADRVDAFFAHVQGAARLKLNDGSLIRITYAAKSGHPFTGISRLLIERGEIAAADVTMQSIRGWLRDHPDQVDALLRQNRSYIFFREAPVDNVDDGPVAAAKVALTGGRSIAVDRLLHTFGTPFFIDAPDLQAFGGDGFHRLMIAQDTGTAIVGRARGDLFAGSGDAAGEIAGIIRHQADFYALVPRQLVGG
ncbi:murein transglycosylase A [Paraburkholderia aspalathi]|nr:murein transglycosylase A [Paraburkholderia aspalathi]